MNRSKIKDDGLRMPSWIRALTYGITVVCLMSGALWLVLHHFGWQEGPFGQTPHPLEHPLLVIHGCFAAFSIWCFGLIFVIHIKRGWRKKLNRLTGSVVVLLMLVLLLSGLGLYYLGDENLRASTSTVHWLVGLIAGIALPAHIFFGRYLITRKSIQDSRR